MERKNVNINHRRYSAFSRKPRQGALRAKAHHPRIIGWYWSLKKSRRYVVAGALVVILLGGGILAYLKVGAAPNLFDTWAFSDQSNYNISGGLETSGSSIRLSGYELPSDGNTAALFHFNETSGSTAADASGNSNTLTNTVSNSWATGVAGNGASFNGTSNNLSAPDSASLSLGTNHSIETWAKLSSAFSSSSSSDQYIVDKGSYKLYFDHNTGRLSYELAKTPATFLTTDYSHSAVREGHRVMDQLIYGSDVYYIDAPTYSNSGTLWRYDSANAKTYQVATSGDLLTAKALAANGSTLYVSGGDKVYSCDMATGCATRTAISAGFSTYGNYYGVSSLYYQGGRLYAGTSGTMGTLSAVFTYNSGTSWSKIGGSGTSPTGWTSLTYQGVIEMTGDGSTAFYVGILDSSSNVQIWKCVVSGAACSSWTLLTTGWKGSTSYDITHLGMTFFGGNLYAMNYNGTGYDVRRYSGSGNTWTTLTLPWTSTEYGTGTLTNDGTNLYAASNSGGRIYKCTTPTSTCGTWVDITNTTGIAGTKNSTYRATAFSLTYKSGLLYAAGEFYPEMGIYISKYNGSTWSSVPTPLDGGNKWLSSMQSMATYNGSTYVGIGNKSGESTLRGAGVYRRDGQYNWVEVAGNGTNGSWVFSGGEYNNVNAMVQYSGKLYVALGGANAGDGEVWSYDGSTWTKVGGDGVNGSWNTSYESVTSLSVYNNQLYAGTGNSAGDATVWRYGGSTWTKVGGDGVNSSWATADGINTVSSMTTLNGILYVGLGNSSSTTGKVYTYNGTSWTQIGGSGTSGNWSSAYDVSSLASYNGKIYAGVQSSSSTYAYVQRYDGVGTGWTTVAGSTVSGTWTAEYKTVSSLAVYNGQLFAGLSVTNTVMNTYNNGGLYVYNGSAWSKPVTSFNPGSYSGISVQSLLSYSGMLLIGTGGYNDDGEGTIYAYPYVLTYGANAVLQSSATSWDTSWHKLAASYDGSTMKLYVDGTMVASKSISQTLPAYAVPLIVGRSIDTGQGYFSGTLDDLRLSNTTRSSFPALFYTNITQTVSLAAAARKQGVWHWDGWSQDATLNGGTITYRLSNDGGSTWLYWNGSAWTISSDTSQANDVSTINSNISSLTPNFDGITWQAVLKGDGTQQVTLNSVSLTSTSDTTAPSANATAIQAKKAASDSTYSLASNGWTNGASPYFSWTAGSDSQSGVYGYCAYLGQDTTADPVTTKGMLGVSPVTTGGNCQYATTSTSLDLGNAGVLATALSTSSDPYYLNIKAIDKAGNVIGSSASFSFRFDNTAPTNPMYITAPSGFVNDKAVTLSWPTSGTGIASDANSGVAGLQYKINNSQWYGDGHTASGGADDMLANDGAYMMQSTPDYSNLNEGINTVYFRTWDNAGNIAETSVTAIVKINTTGAPSEPLELVATPAVNTKNLFSFSWSRPTSLVGDANAATYCYVVNTLPNSSNCSYTAPGVTTLAEGAYATQPGANTLYVVAKDESKNINYSNYASVEFSANTPAPGMPQNTDVADVSIKTTKNWRLAITWEVPTDTGTGVSVYKLSRSTDGTNFAQIGTSLGTSYIDTGLSQQAYYYHVVACDSANNCGAPGTTVNASPTGKYTSPATLVSEPVASNITTKRATITWSTDRVSDSRISIGTTSGTYQPPEILLSSPTTAHSVDLTNLSPGTTYYVQAKWTDEDGNTGHSQEIVFKTSPAPIVKEVTTTSVSLSSATLSFTSMGAYKVALYYGLTDSFGGVKSINTSASESTYSLSLDGLNDGTKYYFQPVAYDSEGSAYPGNIFSFVTPPRPRITNIRFQPVIGEPTSTQQITWTTNVPASSTISYGIVGGVSTEVTKSQMVTDHSITISGLADNSVYSMVAQSRDANGVLAVSDSQQFKTALDTRPPKISDVEIETSIRGTGSQSRGQIIISWKTDEPATSQVAYNTGANAKDLNSRTTEDAALSTQHIVIISNLSTSELYTVQPISSDHAQNQAGGERKSAIIGRGSDDILTIVLGSLQKLFGL